MHAEPASLGFLSSTLVRPQDERLLQLLGQRGVLRSIELGERPWSVDQALNCLLRSISLGGDDSLFYLVCRILSAPLAELCSRELFDLGLPLEVDQIVAESLAEVRESILMGEVTSAGHILPIVDRVIEQACLEVEGFVPGAGWSPPLAQLSRSLLSELMGHARELVPFPDRIDSRSLEVSLAQAFLSLPQALRRGLLLRLVQPTWGDEKNSDPWTATRAMQQLIAEFDRRLGQLAVQSESSPSVPRSSETTA